MREVALVGAKHAVSVPGFMGERVFEVEPPLDFIDVVPGIDSNTRVGIEGSFDSDAPADNMLDNHWINYKGSFLFRALQAALQPHVKSVSSIDDEYLSRTLIPRLNNASYDWSVKAHYNGWLSDRQERTAGKVRALFNQLNTNIREDRMFERIAENDYDILIMGQAHADMIAADEALQNRLGVTVASHHDIVPVVPYYDNPYKIKSVDSILQEVQLGSAQDRAHNHAVERKLVQRRFNAYTVGRVRSRKSSEPDILGRFNITGPAASSLFELTIKYRDGNNFSGIIHDVLGDAHAAGMLDDEKLDFVKTYNLSTVGKGDYSMLKYWTEGREGAKCKGRWQAVEDVTEWPFTFTAVPYSDDAYRELDCPD